MNRWLLHLITATSLLACVALAVLWVDSYWHDRQIYIARHWFQAKKWTEHALTAYSESGGISIYWDSAYANEDDVEWGAFPERTGDWQSMHSRYPAWRYPQLIDEVAPGHQRFGFAFGYCDDGFMHLSYRRGYQWEIIFPYPVVWTLSAAITAFLGFHWLRRRRRPREGLCRRCGYDLRAHRPGQKCPECGTLIERPT